MDKPWPKQPKRFFIKAKVSVLFHWSSVSPTRGLLSLQSEQPKGSLLSRHREGGYTRDGRLKGHRRHVSLA